jgi:hypothetical protein
MLNRERIIPVEEKTEILEALVKHRNNFDVMVANIQSLREILAEGILNKLCDKINIKIPPIIAIYKSGQESIIKNTNASKYQCKFLKYDENDLNFPITYAQTIKTVHPKVNIDMNRANEVWLNPQNPQDIVDIQGWLGEEGFIDVPVKSVPKAKPKQPPQPPPKEKEEKNESSDMYSELEKKYQELLQCYENLKKED